MKQRTDYQITQPDGSVFQLSITEDVVEPVGQMPLTITLSGTPEEKSSVDFYLNDGDAYSIIDYDMLSEQDRVRVKSMLAGRNKILKLGER